MAIIDKIEKDEKVNNFKDLEKVSWRDRDRAFAEYKRLRAFSRRKTAPKELKKKMNDIKKLAEIVNKTANMVPKDIMSPVAKLANLKTA